jgi:hypothetical protein
MFKVVGTIKSIKCCRLKYKHDKWRIKLGGNKTGANSVQNKAAGFAKI